MGLMSKIQVRPLTYFVFLVINGIGRTLTSYSCLWDMPQAELKDKSIPVIKEALPGFQILATNCPEEIHGLEYICRMY